MPNSLSYRCIPFLIVGFAIGVALAEDNVPKPQSNDQRGSKKVFMWKVQSKEAVLFLLGSIHVAKKELYPLDQRIEEAFEKSKSLVVEINIIRPREDKEKDAELQKWFLPEGEKLSSHLGKETKALLQEYLKKNNLPEDRFEHLKPWAAMISVSYHGFQGLGYDPKLGIDRHFLEKATDKKEIIELEDGKSLWDDMDGLPDKVHELSLRNAIERTGNLPEILSEQLKLWEAGDAKGVEDHQVKHFYTKGLEKVREIDLDNRNKQMTEKLLALLKKGGTYFVVIGAGHLVGDLGIIGLLKKEGVQIEQE